MRVASSNSNSQKKNPNPKTMSDSEPNSNPKTKSDSEPEPKSQSRSRGVKNTRGMFPFYLKHLESKINKTRPIMKRTKGDTKGDLEDIYFAKNKLMEQSARKFAEASLSYFNKEGELNYVLVKPGLYHLANFPGYFLVHTHFQARSASDPKSDVYTLFAQLRYGSDITVDLCVGVGISKMLSDRRDKHACTYCGNLVYHPLGSPPGINYGWPSWSSEEEEEDEESSDRENEGEESSDGENEGEESKE